VVSAIVSVCGITAVVIAIGLFAYFIEIEGDKPGDFGPVENGPFEEPERVKR
jgi:hypothetical protein